MGYAGARGGMQAILAAEDLVRRSRDDAPVPWASTEQITARFRLAVDRVMGEGALYDEGTAAAALRQAEGDPQESAHLVRAHRSTLPRLAVSEPVDPNEMVIMRRIVSAYREPDGPQLLGRTTDYTRRLLDRTEEAPAPSTEQVPAAQPRTPEQRSPRRFLDLLREMGLAVDHRGGEDADPVDIARVPARPPAPRSAVLASMARAETGALVALWYRSILGPDGDVHEVTLGEVRHGRVPLRVRHPHTGDPVTIGVVPGHRGGGDRGPRRRRRGPQPLRRRLRNLLRAQRTQGDRDGGDGHREPAVRPFGSAGATAPADHRRARLRRLSGAPQTAALRHVPLDGGPEEGAAGRGARRRR